VNARDDRSWLPRTPREKLIRIDTVLVEIIDGYAMARRKLLDLQPGHSGRPAGTGEPPGGSGGGGATVVERTLLGADPHADTPDDQISDATPRATELEALANLDRLVGRVGDRLADLLVRNDVAYDRVRPLVDAGVRRLVWCRWASRLLIAMSRPRVPGRDLDRLWIDVEQLATMVMVWGPGRPSMARRTDELAHDDSGRWCRSHLRIGVRSHRSDRYAQLELCRTCGDFQAEQGFMPTLEILDAIESGVHGSTIAKMIRDEHAARRPAKLAKKRSGKPVDWQGRNQRRKVTRPGT
jgi:hypothetical protein